VNKQSLVAYGTRSASYDVRARTPAIRRFEHVDVAEGSFFGEQEDFTHSRVAVLGYDVKKKLFFPDRMRLARTCVLKVSLT